MTSIAPGAVHLYLLLDRTIFSLYFPVSTFVALPKKCSENKVLVVLLQIGAKDLTVGETKISLLGHVLNMF